MQRTLVLFMFSLFFSAGVLHLVNPKLFIPAIPPFFSNPHLIVILTGWFEIVLAMLFLSPAWRNTAGQLGALYLVFLFPIHIYVSLKKIPMFGVSHPILLWSRTFFQAVLIMASYKAGKVKSL